MGPAAQDLTTLWVAGAVAALRHAARSPLVRAHGAVGLAVEDLRDGADADEVASLLEEVRTQVATSLEIVEVLVGAAVPGRPCEPGASTSPAGPVRSDAGAVAAAAADLGADASLEAARGAASSDGPRWRLTVDGQPVAGHVAVLAADDRPATVTVLADLLARFDVPVEVQLPGRTTGAASVPARPADLDAALPGGDGRPRSVPLDDPEEGVRRLAQARAHLAAPTAVAVALALTRFAATGGRVYLEG